MPRANSLTLMPQSLAVVKWPSSWIKITAPKTRTEASMVMNKDMVSP